MTHIQHPALLSQRAHPVAPERDGEYMIAAELAQIDCESLSAKQALRPGMALKGVITLIFQKINRTFYVCIALLGTSMGIFLFAPVHSADSLTRVCRETK